MFLGCIPQNSPRIPQMRIQAVAACRHNSLDLQISSCQIRTSGLFTSDTAAHPLLAAFCCYFFEKGSCPGAFQEPVLGEMSFIAVIPNFGPPDVLGLQLPEAFSTPSAGQDFWELKSKNIWRPKVGDHWYSGQSNRLRVKALEFESQALPWKLNRGWNQ